MVKNHFLGDVEMDDCVYRSDFQKNFHNPPHNSPANPTDHHFYYHQPPPPWRDEAQRERPIERDIDLSERESEAPIFERETSI